MCMSWGLFLHAKDFLKVWGAHSQPGHQRPSSLVLCSKRQRFHLCAIPHQENCWKRLHCHFPAIRGAKQVKIWKLNGRVLRRKGRSLNKPDFPIYFVFLDSEVSYTVSEKYAVFISFSKVGVIAMCATCVDVAACDCSFIRLSRFVFIFVVRFLLLWPQDWLRKSRNRFSFSSTL